jgi:hypothetical protein
MPHKVKQGYCPTMPRGKKNMHVESKLLTQYYQLRPTCCVHQHTEGQKSGTNTFTKNHRSKLKIEFKLAARQPVNEAGAELIFTKFSR